MVTRKGDSSTRSWADFSLAIFSRVLDQVRMLEDRTIALQPAFAAIIATL